MRTTGPIRILLTGLAVLGLGAFAALRPAAVAQTAGDPAQGGFVMPELSPAARDGARAYDAVCAACHGQNGLGTDHGPPLVHDIYNPGHHGDRAFLMAAMNGVRQHHWPFGDMPPQQVTPGEVARIVTYIRELQQANGITYRPHKM